MSAHSLRSPQPTAVEGAGCLVRDPLHPNLQLPGPMRTPHPNREGVQQNATHAYSTVHPTQVFFNLFLNLQLLVLVAEETK